MNWVAWGVSLLSSNFNSREFVEKSRNPDHPNPSKTQGLFHPHWRDFRRSGGKLRFDPFPIHPDHEPSDSGVAFRSFDAEADIGSRNDARRDRWRGNDLRPSVNAKSNNEGE